MHLESTVTLSSNFHEIHFWIDDYIPFCEYFVVPYFMWFMYITVTVGYFMVKNKEDYWNLVSFLCVGMTIFIIVSYLYPNGQYLRPTEFPRQNIFTTMVKGLYIADTPTNILPSIHVYNSIGAHIAIHKSKNLSKHKGIQYGSFLLMVSIILSTMFLKQHSVIDVIAGIGMAIFFYVVIYKAEIVKVVGKFIQEKRINKQSAVMEWEK
ncbi:MAG TPA: phosphatase PAP2 family protein [Candidatus Merdenecus merdavium]|nr:phosphatase PAP2 family protein [Candidatus Merdenecus merdavium]